MIKTILTVLLTVFLLWLFGLLPTTTLACDKQVALQNNSHYNKHMYQILKNGKLLINADNLETAVVYVRSLESELIRGIEHSPYTIIKA